MINLLEKIAEIKQLDREIHAFVEYANENLSINIITNSPNGGVFQTKMPESALYDWTFAIKSNIAVSGLAHTAGIAGFATRVATTDAFAVAALRAAGAAIIGTVNMQEAALGATNHNAFFGKTHHPHAQGYTPGGSSGGSAAAVAAGMVRAALGTDTMGSCRIPAAYCGVVGFKPSYGRISCDGVEPLSRRLDHVGILARTVDDAAQVFAVLDTFDAGHADARQYPHQECNIDNLEATKTRLAVLDNPSRHGLQNDVRQAYETALLRLQRNGYTLIERAVDQVKLAAVRRAGLVICEAELANSLSHLLDKGDEAISANLRAMIAFGQAQSAPKLARAHALVDDAELILRSQMIEVDALCWPTAPQSAFAFDAPIPANQADFTCLANFTGAPAISLPLPTSTVNQGKPAAMPTGLQIMAARGNDVALLAMATAIERIIL